MTDEKKANMADKTAKDLDYLTPPSILEPVRRYFGGQIPLDPATTGDNPCEAAAFYFPPRDDGLRLPWENRRTDERAFDRWGAFVNPPYGKELKRWMAKIGKEAGYGVTVLALLPVNRFEQDYFQDNILRRANAACFIRSRVSFIRPSTGEAAKGNPYPSVLWGLNVEIDRFDFHFNHLGCVVALEAMSPPDDEVVGDGGSACVACGGTGKNSKGGPCLPCSTHTGEAPADPVPTPTPAPADPALEGFL